MSITGSVTAPAGWLPTVTGAGPVSVTLNPTATLLQWTIKPKKGIGGGGNGVP